jgi:hypothetical protein
MKTIKFLLTTIAVLLGSVMANAYDFEVDGIYYNILSSTDLTAEVTHGDNKYTGDVIIPSTVNYKSRDIAVIVIGDSAFLQCYKLTNIIIPSTIITIGEDAFYECNNLTNITIPNSVTSISEGAFSLCTSLKELRIEDGDTNLEMAYAHTYTKWENQNSSRYYYYYHYGLFNSCPLEILYLGRNLTYKIEDEESSDYPYYYYYYYYSPFYQKTELKSVTIGNLVTTIGEELFSGCRTLESIIIPKSVTNINNNAFAGCTSLKELHIEDGNTELAMGYGKIKMYEGWDYYYYGLFHDCPLESLHIGRNLAYRLSGYEGLFDCTYDSPFGENSTLKSVIISDSVAVIRSALFHACDNLTCAIIGNNVQVIEGGAFEDCINLTNISIPNSVTSIGNFAFSDCSSITDITIPNSVEEIGHYAFHRCTSLKYVKIEDSTNALNVAYSSTSWSHIFYECSLEKVYLGRDMSNSNRNYVFYSIDTLIIGNNVTKIGKNMFCEGANISRIYSMCTNPPVIDSGNDFTESQYVNTTIFVPKGTLTAYQTADVWKDFWDIQEYVLDKKFCVNYYIDGELYAVDSVKHCDTIILREEPIKEGYTFSGWSEAPETMPAHDVDVIGSFIFASVTDVKVDAKQSWKVIEDNQLFIMLPNGKKYNIMGQKVK